MGKGRSPCCDKNKVKRGPWNPEEDIKLITFIQKHGHDNWRSLPRQAGLLRCGKSCRLRWINYLRPDVKRGSFTKEEEETIIRLHEALGNKWSKIASHLPGRTDNEIKNVWNTHLKKRFKKSSESNTTADELSITSSSSSSSPNNTSKVVGDDGFNEQGPQVTIMAVKTDQQNSKSTHVSDELNNSMIIPENPKESSPSFSSIDSTISNLAQIVNKPEELMSSDPFTFLGPYDTLNEVDKPNSSTLQLEIPFESDYDFWNMLDNIGSLQQSNEVQVDDATAQTLNHGHKKVEDTETRKWLHDLEKELGLGETEEEKNQLEDHQYFLPKNDDAAEAGIMDPQKTLDFEMMTNPGPDQEMAYFQLFSV